MRTLTVSDIHSNLKALQAVLDDASVRGSFDELWCLGIRWGTAQTQGGCIELLKQYDCVTVAGDHDLAAVGMLSTDDFNSSARVAACWAGSGWHPTRDLPGGPDPCGHRYRRDEPLGSKLDLNANCDTQPTPL